MPNWCSNYLTVTGMPELVEQFIIDCWDGAADSNDEPRFFSFQPLVPVTEDADIWAATNAWGTKWDAKTYAPWQSFARPDTEDIAAQLTFETAWSPPTGWLEVAAARYPQLRFDLEYEEIGNALYGALLGENGQVMHEEREGPEFEYDDDADLDADA